ncbi:MAG TPA: NAD-dependent epimerase/dehydratase family protein, partial [Acidimicrobiales bacterium]|nr:NAD-dependent epimerase/dehydratase family protein [Acidimicrobiales bacterium]
ESRPPRRDPCATAPRMLVEGAAPGIVDVVRTIVFTGAAGAATASVVAAVLHDSEDASAVMLTPRPMTVPRARVHPVDLVGVDLDAHLDGAAAVVHLGCPVDESDPYQMAEGRAVDEARAVLDAATRCGVADVVVVSSALVLGALASNPVPLTERAVVHPAPGFRPAVEMAEIERLVAERRADGATITVVRAAPVVADASPGWLAAELHRSLAYPVDDCDPGLQYLHADDLGSAIATVLRVAPGGVVHAAPDGALSGADRRALETRPRLRVPDPVARLASSVRAAASGTGTPEGIRPYLAEEWLLANDRLRELGWEPSQSNEQAYVAAFRAAPWSMIPSGRRQELLLGGLGVVAAGAAVVAGVLARRRHR